MADIMTELLCRREILSKKIEEIKADMSKIPSDFFRYRDMANQVEIMEGKLKEVILEIYRERSQVGLFDDTRH